MLAGKKIVVLKGGPGNERSVSLESAKSVVSALTSLGAEVTEVDVQGDDFELPDDVDVAFNVIHGTYGEDGRLQRALEKRGIVYTGARALSSVLAFDKVLSKKQFVENDVPTPAYEVIDLARNQPIRMEAPLVIKPPREGSSVGVHIVKQADQLFAAVEDVRKYGDDALVEKFIPGRELTVGIVGDRALPVVEIKPTDGFYDMNNKYPWMGGGGSSQYECPAQISEVATQKVQAAALRAHRAIGVEVYSRVDVILDESDNPWVLEVNTIPGMTSSSLLPKAARAMGVEFPELCAQIIQLSIAEFNKSHRT
jgi:D-alanine-D-alanine ligase